MDETYIKLGGRWVYLYRAVDKTGRSKRSPRLFDAAFGRHRHHGTAGIDAADATCSADRGRDVIGQEPGTRADIEHMFAGSRFQGFEDLAALRHDIRV